MTYDAPTTGGLLPTNLAGPNPPIVLDISGGVQRYKTPGSLGVVATVTMWAIGPPALRCFVVQFFARSLRFSRKSFASERDFPRQKAATPNLGETTAIGNTGYGNGS